jgi:signal transduction histidine kinase
LRSYVSMILEMPWPAIIFWGENQIQIYNDGYAVIMGPRHPRYFGARYRDCWPDTYPTIYPWMRKVLDRGEVVEVERTHIPLTRFGFDEEAYFTFIFSPLRDDAGRIAGILQPVFEVTAEVLSARRAELLRAVSEVGRADDPLPRLAAAIGAHPRDIPFAVIWLRDAEGRLTLSAGVRHEFLANDVAARLEAASAQAAASKDAVLVDDFGVVAGADTDVPGAQRALVLPIEDETGAAAQGVIVFGISARLHFDDRYRQFLEQAMRQVAASLRQATALRALERQRSYLNELFLQAPAGIALLAGRNHVFELVNPIYRSMIGGRDVVGRPIRDALPELEDQPFLSILDEVYRTGTPYVGREVSVWLDSSDHGQREEVVFTFLYQPLRDATRAVTGILVMCYDVTPQVRERERAEALALELRQEHKRKDEFLAMLAHELRNPLAPISSAAQVLRLGGLDEARQQWASQLIARQVAHMASLVDDLLDVSRVTRGLVEIERRPLDLKSVVSEAGEQVRPLLEARQHRFVVELPAGAAHVIGDRKRLVQVLSNLLNNAAKYTAEGGTVAVEVSLDAETVRIDVRDNGIGIAAELLPRVFDLFVQAERSGDRSQGGLGIGLALVKTLVELHGGSVAATSAGADQGSVFTVVLPRAADGALPNIGLGPTAAVRSTVGKRVLVVDDNVDAAEALGVQLQSSGHRVTIEHDGVAALASARREPPEVCLLDIGLPGMDGYELARSLRAFPETAHALLVALTGYGQDADRSRAIAAGFDRYVVKPIDPEQLSQVIGS